MAVEFSKQLNADMTKASWLFIFNDRETGEFTKPHVLDKEWSEFEKFFQRKRELYLFIEDPVKGIVTKEGKFWVFLDFQKAAKYFQRQTERPKNFGPQAVRKFPPVPLLNPFSDVLGDILAGNEKRVMTQIKKIEDLLEMADYYLVEEEAVNFNREVKKLIMAITLKEVRLLQTDITNAGVSPTLLEKRLRAIYRICTRFYAKKNQTGQKEALKTLFSPKTVVRKKALELVEKQLASDSA